MVDVLQAPAIPDLRVGQWIDLERLGSDPLATFIKFDGIAIGQILWPNWRGCSAVGEAVDFADAQVEVSTQGGYTPELGMPIPIANATLKALDQGWAFYSYAVSDTVDPDGRGPESFRLFCYVGKRVGRLPVPQLKQSHDLALDIDTLPPSGATVVVPPYRAMNTGDKVTFTFQGYEDNGDADTPFVQTKTLNAADIGWPLKWSVPPGKFSFLTGGHAELSYSVAYIAGEISTSPTQTIRMVAPVSARLPSAEIKNHSGGPLNPDDFLDGVDVQVISLYPDIQAGDDVLLYWTGFNDTASVVTSLRVDQSTIDSRVLEFHIDTHWLSDNASHDVELVYQYASATAGMAQTSNPLTVAIRAPLVLPAPIVEGATGEGSDGDKGFLLANNATSGVYVKIPLSVTLPPGATVAMHWQGHPAGGEYIALTPVADDEKRFFVPETFVAANMGSEGKRFPVFYRVTVAGEAPVDSERFNLRIEPLELARYPTIQCTQALANGTLSLAQVMNGADLTLARWTFMAEGQLLTIQVTGTTTQGNPVQTFVRDALAVTAEEFRNQQITAKIPVVFLTNLKINEKFSLKVRASFDGGNTEMQFKDASIQLVA